MYVLWPFECQWAVLAPWSKKFFSETHFLAKIFLRKRSRNTFFYGNRKVPEAIATQIQPKDSFSFRYIYFPICFDRSKQLWVYFLFIGLHETFSLNYDYVEI